MKFELSKLDFNCLGKSLGSLEVVFFCVLRIIKPHVSEYQCPLKFYAQLLFTNLSSSLRLLIKAES